MRTLIAFLTILAVLPQAAMARRLVINEYFSTVTGKTLPVVYELPADADRQKTIDYIKDIHDSFFKTSEFIDAAKISSGTLEGKLGNGFVLYTVFGGKSSILGAVKLPEFEYAPGRLSINGGKFSGNLRFIFLARNPYSDTGGLCQIYAAGSNKALNGINNVMHGPASYHVFKGREEAGSGFYDGNFAFEREALPLADAAADINEFFTKAEHVHPDLLASLQPEAYTALKKRTLNTAAAKMNAKGLIAVKDLAYELLYAAAAFNDGHTSVSYGRDLPKKYIDAARFPPFTAEFRNGAFYVLAARDPALKGTEIISVNGVPFRAFLKPVLDRCSGELFPFKARRFTGDQRFWWAISELFSGAKNFSLEVREPSGRVTKKKTGVIGAEDFSRLDAAGVSKTREATRLEFLENGAVAYFRYPSFAYSDAEKKTIDGIFAKIKSSGAKSLIIDIRGNGGGNSSMGEFIMKYITEKAIRSFSAMQVKVSDEVLANPRYYDMLDDMRSLRGLLVTRRAPEEKQRKPDAFFAGKLYLLTDNGTFSSASDFAAMFRDYDCGRIIGYETGGLPTCFGDVFSMTLENSRIGFGVSYKKFYGPRPRPGDDEHGVLPDVPVTAEILNKYKTPDPVLTFAVEQVKSAE